MSHTPHSADIAEIMIAEVHHRFFNSLQVISSLANSLTREGAALPVRRSLAADLQRRIAALSELHHMLAAPHGTNLHQSCEALCETLASGFGRTTTINVFADVQPVSPALARGVMLILAELVTNAMKHAPATQDLDLAVSIDQDHSSIRLVVSNPYAREAAQSHRTSVPQVARLLAERLGGTLRVTAGERYVVEVQLPLEATDGMGFRSEGATVFAAA